MTLTEALLDLLLDIDVPPFSVAMGFRVHG